MTSSLPIHFDNVRVLTFDIYGTLVDWETGIVENLQTQPLQARLTAHSRQQILETFEELESQVQGQHPDWLEDRILVEVYHRFAAQLGVSDQDPSLSSAALAFGGSMGAWPVFPDTPAAMQKLAKSYKLVALSNVDRESLQKTLAGPLKDVRFDAVHTAAEIGSYKPDLRNFAYLVDAVRRDYGAEKSEMVHVACSLYHDVAPATKTGIRSVFVDREGFCGTKLGPKLDPEDPDAARKTYGFSDQVKSLGELADRLRL
jgi:2-haloalkanoic acid dehalogenase type II